MANNKVTPSNGIWSLGGTRDAEISGIDPNQYDVYTETDKLDAARQDFPSYEWFTSFTVTKKGQNAPANVQYTLTFNGPVTGTLYYYLNKNVHALQPGNAPNKGNQARMRTTLNVGDPPIGMT